MTTRVPTIHVRFLVSLLIFAMALGLVSPTRVLTNAAAAGLVTVTGTVRDDRSPVSGTRVDALNTGTATVSASAVTDASGFYSMSLTEGTYDFRVTPPAGYQAVPSVTKTITATSPPVDFVLVVERSMATVTGKLANSLGQGLPGKTVKLEGTNGFVASAVTDANGNYSVTVPPGDYKFQVLMSDNNDPAGNVSQTYLIKADEAIPVLESRVQNITLPFRRVTVTVVDPSGIPVAGSRITVPSVGVPINGLTELGNAQVSGASSYPVEALSPMLTDAAGQVTLWLYPTPGSYQVQAEPPAGTPYQKTGIQLRVTGETQATITLARAITVTGRVKNALGEGIPGLKVVFNNRTVETQVTTDATGSYSVILTPGSYLVSMHSYLDPDLSRHATPTLDFTAADFLLSESRTLDFTLPLHRIDVHVQDQTGAPLTGVPVWTHSWNAMQFENYPARDYGANSNAYGLSQYRMEPFPKTDANGNATLWLLSRSRTPYTIGTYTAATMGGSVTTFAASDETLTIVAQDLATVTGTITTSLGAPAANLDLRLWGPVGYSQQIRTDSAGRFSFTVPKGDYGIDIWQFTRYAAGTPDQFQVMAHHTTVTGDRTWNIVLPVHRVTVHVKDGANTPIAGVGLATETTGATSLPLESLGVSDFASQVNRNLYSASNLKTDSNGTAVLYLFPAQGNGYTITATPASGQPFLPFTLTGVMGTEDRDIEILLSAAHPTPTTTAVLNGTPDAEGRYPLGTTVTFTATAASGYTVTKTSYRIDGGPVQTYTGSPVSLPAGAHRLIYWSTDNSGVNETLKELPFEIADVTSDTTPPVVTVSVSPEATEAGWHSGDVTVTFTVTDPESAIVTGCDNVTVTGETEGRTLTCQATNSAGLTSEPVSVTVRIDRTAPVTQATEADGTVTFTATDNLSGVLTTFYQVDGGEVQSGTTVTITAPGAHTVTYWSADKAANLEAPQSLTVSVGSGDTTPPVTTADPEPPTDWVREWTLHLTATDDQSGVAATYVTGYGPKVTYADPGLTLNRTGIWDLQYWSVDNAGNVEEPHDYRVLVDHHGPYIWATGGLTPDGIRVFLGGNDLQSGLDYLEWSLDHETWQRYTGSFVLPADFSGRLYYRGFDRLGNVTECVVEIRSILSEGNTIRLCGTAEAGSTVPVKVTDPVTGKVYEMEVPADADGNWCTVIIVEQECTCRVDVGGGGGMIIDVEPPHGGGSAAQPKCGCGWYGGGEDIVIILNPDDGGGSGVSKVEINIGGEWVTVPPGSGSYTIPGGSLGGGGHDILIRTTDGEGNTGTETIHVDIDDTPPNLGDPTWEPGSDRPTFTPSDGESGLGDDGWWEEVFDSHCGCLILIYRCKDKTGNESTFRLYPVPVEPQRSYEGENKEFSLGDLSVIPGSGPWTAKVWWGDDSQPEPFSTAGGALSRTHTYKDNGEYMAVVLVFNSHLQGALIRVPITVENLPPEITGVTGPTHPQLLGTPVTLTADFKDPGILDSHTASIEWGDGESDLGTVHETLDTTGTGSVTFPDHTYAAPGVYTVKITVTDKDGASDEAFYTYVVVYDPEGGFVTGGGWIKAGVGSYTAKPSLTGRANFGFVSKYQKGATIPTGQTEFQFQVADLNFHSTDYEWLVVAGAKAQFKGTGTINGQGSYGFLLTAIDGQVNGGGGTDKFRIKIWDLTTGAVVFDNQMGADETGDASTALSGGSIVIHHEN